VCVRVCVCVCVCVCEWLWCRMMGIAARPCQRDISQSILSSSYSSSFAPLPSFTPPRSHKPSEATSKKWQRLAVGTVSSRPFRAATVAGLATTATHCGLLVTPPCEFTLPPSASNSDCAQFTACSLWSLQESQNNHKLVV
jgi:hypothetical protein